MEIINESLLASLVSMLFYYNESSGGNNMIERAFIYSILLNSAMILFIFVILFIFSIISECVKKKQSDTFFEELDYSNSDDI